MKKLLLVASFVMFESSHIVCQENNNGNSVEDQLKTRNSSSELFDKAGFQAPQTTLTNLIKENPWTALGSGIALGTFIPAKTKIHVLIGATIGAVFVLKATDKNFSDVVDRSFSTVTEKCIQTKDALIDKWNNLIVPNKKS